MRKTSSLISKAASRLRSLRRDSKGAAAVEFALILPLMVMTYVGVSEVSQILSADRRVIAVARAASDLTAQKTTIADTDISAVFDTAAPIMSPFASTTIKITISSVLFGTNPAGSTLNPIPMVDWSVNKNGGTLRACSPNLTVVANNTPASATVVPVGVTANGQSVIIADVSYAYTPLFGAKIVPGGAINLKQTTYMRPRYITRIPFTGATATNCNPNFTG